MATTIKKGLIQKNETFFPPKVPIPAICDHCDDHHGGHRGALLFLAQVCDSACAWACDMFCDSLASGPYYHGGPCLAQREKLK